MNVKKYLAVPLVVFATNVVALGRPNLQEVTAASGIEQQYTGGWEFFVGGGVSAFDCNHDFKPELFIAGGESQSGLFINHTEITGVPKFEPSDQLRFDRATGSYVLDLDSDGELDVIVMRNGENQIMKGQGNCQFESANTLFNIKGGESWTTAFAAQWEGNSKLPTLVFGNYIDQTQPGAPFGTCADHELYRPLVNDIRYSEPVKLLGYCSLSMLFTDWNRNGVADLRSANDRQYYRDGHEQLWDFSSTILPSEYDESDGWSKQKLWGMGIAAQDINTDGLPDYYVTSMADNKLSSLLPRARGPEFEDLAYSMGITAHRPFIGDSVMPSTAWHAQFEDINNDTYFDLLVVKGNVEAMTDFALEDPNNLFLGTAQGPFVESAEVSNFVSLHRGRGGSLVDLNMDGLLDAVVVNRMENVQIWRNNGVSQTKSPAPMGNWLNVLLKQPKPNQHAIGAFVELRIADRTLTKEITVGGGHAGNTVSFHHFGMGVAERAQVRVQWPDGSWSDWIRVFANQFVQLEKGTSTAQVWIP